MVSDSSTVWVYFSKQVNDSECKLCRENPCDLCKKDKPCSYAGHHTTNLRKHLKAKHVEEYQSMKTKESSTGQAKKRPRRESTINAPTPQEFFLPRQISSENKKMQVYNSSQSYIYLISVWFSDAAGRTERRSR